MITFPFDEHLAMCRVFFSEKIFFLNNRLIFSGGTSFARDCKRRRHYVVCALCSGINVPPAMHLSGFLILFFLNPCKFYFGGEKEA